MILFVCTANQCRSPMAEHLMKKRLGGNSRWTVLSAGISAIPNMPASHLAIEAMREEGMDISGHQSRQLTEDLADAADVIVAMTRSHREQICRLFPETQGKVHVLKELGTSPEAGDIEDPIGMSIDVYRDIRDEIDAELPDVIVFLHEKGGK